MLSVMTFNVYISISLVIGGGIGYWIFGPTLMETNVFQFQKQQEIVPCNKECSGNFKHKNFYQHTIIKKACLSSV